MKENRQKIIYIVQNAIFIAIVFIMAFTPLGYFKIGLLAITLIPIPVVIGAIFLGPVSGIILGTTFGITMVLKALFDGDFLFLGLLAVNPFFAVVLCIIPRILMGWFVGLIYRVISKIDKTKIVSYIIASLSGPVMNTIFFLSALGIFFGSSDLIVELRNGASVIAFLVAAAGINAVIEAVVCTVAGTAVSKTLNIFIKP